jgi:hypothetical protein
MRVFYKTQCSNLRIARMLVGLPRAVGNIALKSSGIPDFNTTIVTSSQEEDMIRSNSDVP